MSIEAECALEVAVRKSGRTKRDIIEQAITRELLAIIERDERVRLPPELAFLAHPDDAVRDLLMLFSDIVPLVTDEQRETRQLIDENRAYWFDGDKPRINQARLLAVHLPKLIKLRRLTDDKPQVVAERIDELLHKAGIPV